MGTPASPRSVFGIPLRLSPHHWLLGGIILLGALLRVWNIPAAQYLGDDGDFLQTAQEMVRSGTPLLAFPSSAGISSGPVGLYLVAVPALFTSTYPAIVAFMALLNTLCIPLIYLIGRDAFGMRVGLLAAILAAVNPWLVIYARRTWVTASVEPMAVFFLWTAVRAFRLDTGKSWVLAGFGAAVTMLVHLSGILNVVALGVAALGVRQAIRWKRALPGVAVLALLLAPWTLGSFMAELLSLNPPSPLSSATFTDSSLERATLLVTGVGYQSIAGQAARILNATAPPFTWIDTLARGLGVAGWAWLIWSAWTARRSDPGRAAARLLLVLMAALPVLALARPPQTGAFLTLYPYYFLNTLPALLIGIAALTDHFAARLPWLATALLAPVAGAQLLLAGPFFITHEEYWPLGDYGVPFKYTEELSRQLYDLANSDKSFVLISGEEEDHSQQRLLAQVLTRQYDRVRIFDGRDGVLWRTDTPSLLIVTTNDDEVATRFLRNQFSDLQIIEQRLPGSGWTRRVFRLTATAMESWAERNLDTLVADQAAVIYSRGALADAANLGSVQIAVRWHFEADPPEPFLTKFRLAAGDRELHREEHVSYPAGTWRPGDWQATRILNLFRLPADLVLPSGTEVTITHQGILTGKTSRSGAQIKMR